MMKIKLTINSNQQLMEELYLTGHRDTPFSWAQISQDNRIKMDQIHFLRALVKDYHL